MSDVKVIYTVTLPNGSKQEFHETAEGVFYAGGCRRAPNFAEGLEKVKAMGGTVEVKTL